MIEIKNNTITLVRGDSVKIKLSIYDADGKVYVPIAKDKIRIAIKECYTDEVPIILKDIPSDTLELSLLPTETKELTETNYVYDIQITLSDGTIDTIIPNGKMIVLSEVA